MSGNTSSQKQERDDSENENEFPEEKQILDATPGNDAIDIQFSESDDDANIPETPLRPRDLSKSLSVAFPTSSNHNTSIRRIITRSAAKETKAPYFAASAIGSGTNSAAGMRYKYIEDDDGDDLALYADRDRNVKKISMVFPSHRIKEFKSGDISDELRRILDEKNKDLSDKVDRNYNYFRKQSSTSSGTASASSTEFENGLI